MQRSFRRVSTTVSVLLVTGSLLLLALPYQLRLFEMATTNAKRELRLIAEQGGAKIVMHLTSLESGAIDMSSQQDVARGLSSSLFQPHLDTVITEFLKRYNLVSAIYVYDRDHELVSAEPVLAMKQQPPAALMTEIDSILSEDPSPYRMRHLWRAADETPRFDQQKLVVAEGYWLVAFIPGLVNRIAGYILISIPASDVARLIKRPPEAAAQLQLNQAAPVDDATLAEATYVTTPNPFRGDDLRWQISATEPKASRFAPVRETVMYSSALTAALILLCGLVGYYASRWMTSPLVALRQKLDAYSGGDDLPRGNYRFEELQALADTLALMSGRISNYIADLTEGERIKGEMARAQIQAELDTMRTQMNPHFLFNALNSISSMAQIDAKLAADMLQKLADLYRSILESSKIQTQPLSVEIQIVNNYLDLEKMRFGERLTYSFEIPDAADRIHIPGLILQTLVENAVKHGIAKSRGPGWIKIEVVAAPTGYAVVVANSSSNRPAQNPEISHGTGSGLELTKKRLTLLYGSQTYLLMDHEDGTTRVSFWISGEKGATA